MAGQYTGAPPKIDPLVNDVQHNGGDMIDMDDFHHEHPA